jgi:hypothetical protein
MGEIHQHVKKKSCKCMSNQFALPNKVGGRKGINKTYNIICTKWCKK